MRCGEGYLQKWGSGEKSTEIKEAALNMIEEYAMELEGGGNPTIPPATRKAVGYYRTMMRSHQTKNSVTMGYLEAKRLIYEANK